MIGSLLLALAAAPVSFAYEAPANVADGFDAAIETQSRTCGLNKDAFQWHGATVEVEPRTAADKAALDRQVTDALVKGGFSPDAAKSRASSAFARKLLTTRYVVELDSVTGVDGQLACLIDWLKGQGFTDASADVAALFHQKAKR